MSTFVLPFAPLGATVSFTAATPTPPAGVQAPIGDTSGTSAGQYRIVNDSTVTVFLGVGATSTAAIANASAVATSIPLLAGHVKCCALAPMRSSLASQRLALLLYTSHQVKASSRRVPLTSKT
jgi:hypothetical protein